MGRAGALTLVDADSGPSANGRGSPRPPAWWRRAGRAGGRSEAVTASAGEPAVVLGIHYCELRAISSYPVDDSPDPGTIPDNGWRGRVNYTGNSEPVASVYLLVPHRGASFVSEGLGYRAGGRVRGEDGGGGAGPNTPYPRLASARYPGWPCTPR